MIIFDIDGVLTAKVTGININTKMTNEDIKKSIINAKPAKEGFSLLHACLIMFKNLFHCFKSKNDALAWQQIGFLTGRKKSEYYAVTESLIKKAVETFKFEESFTQFAIQQVIWYPEDMGYKKEDYYKWKLEYLCGILGLQKTILYIDDDADLVQYINNFDIVEGIMAVHFEAKE